MKVLVIRPSADMPLHLLRAMTDELVQVVVGVDDHKTSFKVHLGVLAKQSRYFDAAFNGDFLEGHTGSIVFPEDTEETFRRFMFYCYHLSIRDPQEDSSALTLDELVELYIFGDLVDCPGFRREVMSWLLELAEAGDIPRDLPLLRYIFEHTPQRSPLRIFMIDLWVLYHPWRDVLSWDDEQFDEALGGDAGKEIMFRLAEFATLGNDDVRQQYIGLIFRQYLDALNPV